jgi:hypothetical protein
MRGDLADIVARLRAVLPKRWFAEQSPNLSAILRCVATPWAWLYSSIAVVIAQTRINTATDDWLDLISHDYFGDLLNRDRDELDSSYRVRVKAALLRDAATRSAVTLGLENLTGSSPFLFEPARCLDTGSYGSLTGGTTVPWSGLAYGRAGGWGSLMLPFQIFVTAIRPPTPGIGMMAGYGTPNAGYGEGPISYVGLSTLPGHVTDQNIQATLISLLPVNAIAWLRIQ